MKKLLFVLITLCLLTSICCAQSATPGLWRKGSPAFKTEAEFRTLAKTYRDNSRVSYYLILRAYNQGKAMTKSALLTYFDLYQADASNLRVQAAFAFACYIANDYDLEWGTVQDPELKKLEWRAAIMRPLTVKAFPTDPTILIMAARPTYFMNKLGVMENLPDMKRGITWAKQAIRYEQNWPESHYWLAMMLQWYAMNNPVTATKGTDQNIKRQSIQPALTALRLGTQAGDRTTQIGCWSMLALAYSPFQKQLALTYLDKYIAAIPPTVKKRQEESLIPWRQSLVDDIAKSRMSKG